jgi:hypothetical protein
VEFRFSVGAKLYPPMILFIGRGSSCTASAPMLDVSLGHSERAFTVAIEAAHYPLPTAITSACERPKSASISPAGRGDHRSVMPPRRRSWRREHLLAVGLDDDALGRRRVGHRPTRSH